MVDPKKPVPPAKPADGGMKPTPGVSQKPKPVEPPVDVLDEDTTDE